MSETVDSYVRANRERFLDEVKEFLRIPSISTSPEHAGDVAAAARFTAEKLKAAGIENVEIIPTERHPLVYGDWLRAPGKPTVLCYGHFDVQPPDPLELWHTPPFEPTVRDGNLYARGAADDKGQFMMHVKAFETLMAVNGRLPVNVKIIVEGEEEVGGASIAKYVASHQDKLKADVALISDTALYAEGIPTLCVGLRGLVYMEIECRGPSRDLHSGLYGGAAPNPIFALIELLGKAKDAEGRIQITGFYEDVEEPTAKEIESWKSLPFSEEDFLNKEVGAPCLTGEPDRLILERVWSRPTLEVHGIGGGFTGTGAKTVIPATATAKISTRLVPKQDPEKMFKLFSAWVQTNTPKGVTMEVRRLSGNPAVVVDPEHAAMRLAADAFEEVMGRKTVFTRSGGSIPIVGEFASHLKIPAVLMGFGLPDDGLHSPNEKFKVENFYLGTMTVAHFLEKYGSLA